MLKIMLGGLRLRSADVEHPHASGTFGMKSRAHEGWNWVKTYRMAEQPRKCQSASNPTSGQGSRRFSKQYSLGCLHEMLCQRGSSCSKTLRIDWLLDVLCVDLLVSSAADPVFIRRASRQKDAASRPRLTRSHI